MGIFTILFLIFIGYFLVWPVIRTLLVVRAARRNFTGAGASRRQAAAQPGRKAGWSGFNPLRRKKITKDVGEYVAFEEISVTAETSARSTSPGGSTTFVKEQQVVDVEWEEIR